MKSAPTSQEDKVSTGSKIGHGLGFASQRIQMNGLNQMANPVFNDVLGIDPRLIGMALGVSRIFDAVTDPIIGHLSDKTRSRFGRRRPWIAASAIVCGIAFPAVWLFPRGMSENANLAWFIATTVFLFFGLSLFTVPYNALGMELSPDYHERTSVMAYRAVMAKVGGFLVSSLFVFVTLDCFDDIAEGMRYVGIGLGLMILIFSLCPVFFSREHPSSLRNAKKRRVDDASLLQSARQTLRNRPFLILVGVTAIMLFGLTMVNHLSYYLIIYHMYGGEKNPASGMLLTSCGFASQIGGLFGIPLMSYASKRIDKRKVLLGALLLACLGDLTKWVCFNPDSPYLALIPNFILALALSAVWTLMQAMLPDVVDYDELKTGQRREGMFSAIHGWTIKGGMSLALMLSGFVLQASGFDASLGLNQDPGAITEIRVFYTFVPALAMLLGFALMWFYPITENRCYAIRSRLERRRAKAPE